MSTFVENSLLTWQSSKETTSFRIEWYIRKTTRLLRAIQKRDASTLVKEDLYTFRQLVNQIGLCVGPKNNVYLRANQLYKDHKRDMAPFLTNDRLAHAPTTIEEVQQRNYLFRVVQPRTQVRIQLLSYFVQTIAMNASSPIRDKIPEWDVFVRNVLVDMDDRVGWAVERVLEDANKNIPRTVWKEVLEEMLDMNRGVSEQELADRQVEHAAEVMTEWQAWADKQLSPETMEGWAPAKTEAEVRDKLKLTYDVVTRKPLIDVSAYMPPSTEMRQTAIAAAARGRQRHHSLQSTHPTAGLGDWIKGAAVAAAVTHVPRVFTSFFNRIQLGDGEIPVNDVGQAEASWAGMGANALRAGGQMGAASVHSAIDTFKAVLTGGLNAFSWGSEYKTVDTLWQDIKGATNPCDRFRDPKQIMASKQILDDHMFCALRNATFVGFLQLSVVMGRIQTMIAPAIDAVIRYVSEKVAVMIENRRHARFGEEDMLKSKSSRIHTEMRRLVRMYTHAANCEGLVRTVISLSFFGMIIWEMYWVESLFVRQDGTAGYEIRLGSVSEYFQKRFSLAHMAVQASSLVLARALQYVMVDPLRHVSPKVHKVVSFLLPVATMALMQMSTSTWTTIRPTVETADVRNAGMNFMEAGGGQLFDSTLNRNVTGYSSVLATSVTSNASLSTAPLTTEQVQDLLMGAQERVVDESGWLAQAGHVLKGAWYYATGANATPSLDQVMNDPRVQEAWGQHVREKEDALIIHYDGLPWWSPSADRWLSLGTGLMYAAVSWGSGRAIDSIGASDVGRAATGLTVGQQLQDMLLQTRMNNPYPTPEEAFSTQRYAHLYAAGLLDSIVLQGVNAHQGHTGRALSMLHPRSLLTLVRLVGHLKWELVHAVQSVVVASDDEKPLTRDDYVAATQQQVKKTTTPKTSEEKLLEDTFVHSSTLEGKRSKQENEFKTSIEDILVYLDVQSEILSKHPTLSPDELKKKVHALTKAHSTNVYKALDFALRWNTLSDTYATRLQTKWDEIKKDEVVLADPYVRGQTAAFFRWFGKGEAPRRPRPPSAKKAPRLQPRTQTTVTSVLPSPPPPSTPVSLTLVSPRMPPLELPTPRPPPLEPLTPPPSRPRRYVAPRTMPLLPFVPPPPSLSLSLSFSPSTSSTRSALPPPPRLDQHGTLEEMLALPLRPTGRHAIDAALQPSQNPGACRPSGDSAQSSRRNKMWQVKRHALLRLDTLSTRIHMWQVCDRRLIKRMSPDHQQAFVDMLFLFQDWNWIDEQGFEAEAGQWFTMCNLFVFPATSRYMLDIQIETSRQVGEALKQSVHQMGLVAFRRSCSKVAPDVGSIALLADLSQLHHIQRYREWDTLLTWCTEWERVDNRPAARAQFETFLAQDIYGTLRTMTTHLF